MLAVPSGELGDCDHHSGDHEEEDQCLHPEPIAGHRRLIVASRGAGLGSAEEAGIEVVEQTDRLWVKLVLDQDRAPRPMRVRW